MPERVMLSTWGRADESRAESRKAVPAILDLVIQVKPYKKPKSDLCLDDAIKVE